MAAAVADYRPRAASPTKLKRTGETLHLELVPNPDLLADIGGRRRGAKPFLVGFALETAKGDSLTALAMRKLETKRVDLVVANSAAAALSRDDNHVTLVTKDGAEALDIMPKLAIADVILDRIRTAVAP